MVRQKRVAQLLTLDNNVNIGAESEMPLRVEMAKQEFTCLGLVGTGHNIDCTNLALNGLGLAGLDLVTFELFKLTSLELDTFETNSQRFQMNLRGMSHQIQPVHWYVCNVSRGGNTPPPCPPKLLLPQSSPSTSDSRHI